MVNPVPAHRDHFLEITEAVFYAKYFKWKHNFKWNNLTKRKNCNTASITFKLYGYVILVCDENCIHKKGITVKCVNIQARGGFIQTNGKIS